MSDSQEKAQDRGGQAVEGVVIPREGTKEGTEVPWTGHYLK
jgi:hypothetical protein